MNNSIVCPSCGAKIKRYKSPVPTVDIIIEVGREIVLIERKNFPYGWALPGGFVDYGESIETAAIREAKEETSLDIDLTGLLGVYSDPDRDPRCHTITTVFIALSSGSPKANDDAKDIGLFNQTAIPHLLVFDHVKILDDYFQWKSKKK
ncbi:NUDIX hydrolase [bacterium]|nr:NUDIX hydrolase [bacterium]